jgi:phosphatidyl-myo-inositol alpha-mannosyltransferase
VPLSDLNICLVSQSYLPYHGGITEHVWHLADILSRRGHKVTILTGTPRHGRLEAEADPIHVNVLRVGKTYRLPSHGARACVTFGWPWQASLRELQQNPPDLVHLMSPLEPFLPLWALKNIPGPKIGTFHTGGKKTHWGYQRFARWLETYSSRLDRRLAVSGEAKRFVAGYFPGDYEIVPNGVDPGRFLPVDPPSACRKRIQERAVAHLLSVGRLDPRKGLETVLEALGHYCRKRAMRSHPAAGNPLPRLELTIVGDGPERSRLERIVARQALPVRFTGIVPRQELPSYYQNSDLFVASSVDGESFGISLLEALASGLPVIASDLAGYHETLAGSDAALHFAAGSSEELSGCLEILLSNPAQRERMSRAGRRHVRQYTWDAIGERIEGIYFDMLRPPAQLKPLMITGENRIAAALALTQT